jgi:hypothetical protein
MSTSGNAAKRCKIKLAGAKIRILSRLCGVACAGRRGRQKQILRDDGEKRRSHKKSRTISSIRTHICFTKPYMKQIDWTVVTPAKYTFPRSCY